MKSAPAKFWCAVFSRRTQRGTDPSTSLQPPAAPGVAAAKVANAAKNPPVSIAISIFHGGIEQTGGPLAKADAISVGHYVGVAPQNAELAIDQAITAALEKKKIEELSSEKGIITSLCRRGVIVGELGQNFFLPDPRDAKRVIVIAGMGRPGMFREAELTVLTRELVWSLGRAGRKNLCTVLIGSGAGNLETPDAMRAWLRGIRRALYDAQSHSEPQIRSVTFVEFNEANLVRLHSALQNAVETFANDSEGALKIEYTPPTNETLRRLRKVAGNEAAKKARVDLRKSFTALTGSAPDPEPIRLTIQLQDDTFQFAALTADASVPQRDTRIDPALVDEANNQLPTAESFAKQLDHGNLLARFLLPTDMRDLIFKQNASIVLALDATTARIHWEMLADQAAGSIADFTSEHFLVTLFGLTRQLRTTFAQLPEPPIISGRPLRVLVVADPDEDAPLPGAQEEGEAVAAIFEEFGREPNRQVEVVRLFGPGQATRVAVLDQLINSRFDMMHYAGHCFFDEKNPQLSGWVFTGGKVLSANELSRIDRVPRFMFSNACESGITPDRASARNALMAPSFAEAFFARGVANFICTAWPIDDTAALEFSRRFYRGILGLRGAGVPAEALHEAMREARREIAVLGPGGMQTWGAYQHYGDPNLRLIPRGSEKAPSSNRPKRPMTKRKSPRKESKPKKSAKRKR